MLIYGAGGHAKVVISCLNALGVSVIAIFDDDLSKTSLSGFSVIGSYSNRLFADQPIIIAIGNNVVRRAIAERIHRPFRTAIHPSAILDESVNISDGTVVMHGSILQANVLIGQHVIVNTHVSVDHDCQIADFVHLAPGVILCGNVRIGENTFIGAGSIVVPNISIGSNCFIAAGSVVTKNIPDKTTARGNPARIIRTK